MPKRRLSTSGLQLWWCRHSRYTPTFVLSFDNSKDIHKYTYNSSSRILKWNLLYSFFNLSLLDPIKSTDKQQFYSIEQFRSPFFFIIMQKKFFIFHSFDLSKRKEKKRKNVGVFVVSFKNRQSKKEFM